METEGIKFFIKFNLTDQYADSLINSGEIYTNCARYYIYQKEYLNKDGIGDDKEGLLLEVLRKDVRLPLYCMYEVNDANLISYNGKCYVKINRLMIDHFANDKNTSNTSFVVINSKGLIKAIKKLQNMYNLRFDKIRYGNLSIYKQKDFINDKTAERLIFKTPEFSYQQEVRLVFDDPFSTLYVTKDKRLCYFENDKFYEYKGKTYHLGNLQEYAIKLNVTDLIKIDETHYGFEYGLVKEIVEKMI